ncbi:uncharacterized protein LOC131076297 isoform X2 [Cryptomeria japonica]|uniref:uncharacterized protein LOC131076297 isoform X2 n=1 Tax=Cryptomeria japonica TaxID=3369 RepID=UPI0025AD4569|nr:uncharacterized protein LOC131076297 isoform X2 [Cryptomeria japonica]
MAIEEKKDTEQLLLESQTNVKGEYVWNPSRPSSDFDWNPSSLHVKSFKRTIRTLQLDHSHKWWSLVSWIVGFVMILVIPILRLIYVKPADSKARHQLVFQPVVVVVGILISAISFIFLSQSMRKYGIQGILFLDIAADERSDIREEYNKIIQRGATQLAKLFIPALVLYMLQKCWFYIDIPLASLPCLNSGTATIVIIAVSVGISWVFQTTTFLYACILFWKVCFLQELKMKVFKDSLLQGYDPEFYYNKYTEIIKCLQFTSRRFRLFLALTGSITVLSALASMYEVVAHLKVVGIFMSGELLVLNMVNLTGIGLCLKSASKISHLHRRIVKLASSMHAKSTFAASKGYILSAGKDETFEFQEKMEYFCQVQDAWSQRSALVNFLSNNSAGISLYGFVLDRFFVHTSIGALLTTTWFLLGRSLSS